jgi:hypothetical protein
MRAKNRLQAVAMTSEGLFFMLLDPHVLLEICRRRRNGARGAHMPRYGELKAVVAAAMARALSPPRRSCRSDSAVPAPLALREKISQLSM